MVSPQDDRALAGAAPRTLDARRLRMTYLDLLGRPPFAHERTRWRGGSFGELVDQLLRTEEFWGNWFEEQLFYLLLVDNFRPASARVLAIPADLAQKKLGVRGALHRVALSPSFDRRNPGPDTFVTVVMEQLLGLRVQKRKRELETGKRIYDGGTGKFAGRSANSQADIVRNAIEDRGALEHLITRDSERLLKRPPAPRDLGAWVRGLESDPHSYGSLMRSWIVSEEYDERLRARHDITNRTFIRMLFVDLTDALAPPGEALRLRIALDALGDAGPLRAAIARLLVDSDQVRIPKREEIPDPTAWVAELFKRLLGRHATEDELVTFVTAFHDPACSPRTVVYAIVSHPEYQTC